MSCGVAARSRAGHDAHPTVSNSDAVAHPVTTHQRQPRYAAQHKASSTAKNANETANALAREAVGVTGHVKVRSGYRRKASDAENGRPALTTENSGPPGAPTPKTSRTVSSGFASFSPAPATGCHLVAAPRAAPMHEDGGQPGAHHYAINFVQPGSGAPQGRAKFDVFAHPRNPGSVPMKPHEHAERHQGFQRRRCPTQTNCAESDGRSRPDNDDRQLETMRRRPTRCAKHGEIRNMQA